MNNLPLKGLKVIELPSGQAGAYCGRLFHQYGAEVTRINYPAEESDNLDQDAEYLHIGKSILEFNFRSNHDTENLNFLLSKSHILIHSSKQNPTTKINLGKINNPKLISISITDMGTTGPLKNLETSDLILQAASGLMSVSKSQNGIPLKIPGNQSYFHAGSYAYSAGVAALFAMDQTGNGCSIEISVLESILPIIAPQLLHSTYSNLPDNKLVKSNNYLIPCQDGEVLISSRDQSSLEILEAVFNIRLSDSKRMIPENDPKVISIQNTILEGPFRNLTMSEIFSTLSPLGILVGMKLQFSDLAADEHLKSRQVFDHIGFSPNNESGIPGLPFKIIETNEQPQITTNQNHKGSTNSLRNLRNSNIKINCESNKLLNGAPLKGFRVLALTHTWSGALTTQLLGALGAEVIQIESPSRPDLWRGPIENVNIDDYPDEFASKIPYNHYFNFNSVNQNKLGMTLNLESLEGREEFLNLVKISDLVVENFSPRVLKNLNLEFESLKNANPSIVMLRMPGYGTYGDYSMFPANGSCIEIMTGISSLLNYSPKISAIMHTDTIAGNLGLAAALTGLYARLNSGKGQLIDLSQQETALSFLGNMFETENPQNQLIENASHQMSPQGVFKCAGKNAWIAITIRNEEDWQRFCSVTKNSEWANIEEFNSLENRLNNRVLLHSHISNWSHKLDANEIEKKLQSSSIPAIKITSISNLKDNLHLTNRKALEPIYRDEKHTDYFVNTPFIINDCRIRNSKQAPEFGEHNNYIFSSILGLDQQKIKSLHAKGITGNDLN